MIIYTSLVIIVATRFFLILIVDKTCHRVANLCLAAFLFGCNLLSMCTFTLKNDLKQIEYQDLLCVFRGYHFDLNCF
jgi:hypothetical protein